MTLDQLLSGEVTAAARGLLGARLLVHGVGGLIVETEAYHPSEPASHAFIGRTARNAAMFLGPGHAYVYRSYGIHWCFNLVAADGAALEPTDGLGLMRERRGRVETSALCSGPGKLCAALDIDRRLDGVRLDAPPLLLEPARQPPSAIAVGPRIGISKAADLPWRFGVAGSPFLSRPFRNATGSVPPRL
jgi:DNA-3-methyladenine glycosylase